MGARHATVFSDTRACAECGRLFPVSLRFASQEACDACARRLKRSKPNKGGRALQSWDVTPKGSVGLWSWAHDSRWGKPRRKAVGK